MCFYSKLSKKAVELENRYKAKFEAPELFTPHDTINGFSYPLNPVICDKDPEVIHLFTWGLIPFWASTRDIQKNTLNARIETLGEKPAFRASASKRCLVLSDGFYEWKWLDAAGKKKQKYLLSKPGDELFSFAGIYSEWLDKETGELLPTYSIVTTEAVGLMAEIHNSKKRMPVVLNSETEKEWLAHEDYLDFAKHEEELIATPV
jgi:putative SOS response-associated peptidase YedK